jgi:DNA-binding transcriptional LysR family regulator
MNFTQAAKELNLTQPAVSKHIRFLEEFYRVKLFIYQNRRLMLTRQGVYLRDSMHALKHDAIRVQEALAGQERKRLKLGATLSIGNYYLPQPLIALLKEREELDVSVTVADTEELLVKLDRGDLDFILCEGNFSKARYGYRLLKQSRLVAVCGREYDTAGAQTLTDLFSHRILLREKGSGTREILEHYLMENGYDIHSFAGYFEINHVELIGQLLAANLGISILYQEVADQMVEKGWLRQIPLRDFQLEHGFHAVWTRGSLHQEEYEQLTRSLFERPREEG